jgi:hypothetical protein
MKTYVKKPKIFTTIQHGFWFFQMYSCPFVCMSQCGLVQREKLNGYELHGFQSLESSIGNNLGGGGEGEGVDLYLLGCHKKQ